MSHTSTVDTVAITSVSALRAAVQALQKSGIRAELVEKAAPRLYYKDQLRRNGHPSEICDYVVSLADCYYDIGLRKKPNGNLEPLFDAHSGPTPYHTGGRGTLQQVVGNSDNPIGQFVQEYSKAATIEAAEAQGFSVSDIKWTADGSWAVVAVKY
ncbi:hypothetical protein UFOVP783_77 [uncultured Caudovirales phage]|uniref:Uncharacterized protein n=1 Tax=uncultured Caudovirales phage TaxID=2100421 RepID=A0A6J5NZS9_9CAUD|nr:hypothetical protein UFOVP783_77 [uncultured Caudovirales phage]